MTRSERVLEARRKFEAGEFDRAVTANEPHDLYWNTLTLECGHQMAWCPRIVRDEPKRERCQQCAKAWVDADAGVD